MAEALIYYRVGDLWYPTREFEAEYMVSEQDARYDHDVWFEQVERWLEPLAGCGNRRWGADFVAGGVEFLDCRRAIASDF